MIYTSTFYLLFTVFKLMYEEDAGTPASSILETKLSISSVIYDANQGTRFCSYDLKGLFLASPMYRPEYIRILWT